LLIRRGNRTEDGFLVLPIDGTSSNFGPGKFLFVNASPTAVAVSMGGSQFALDPGRLRVVKPEPDVGERLSQVSLAYKKEGKWRRFSETRWPVSERSRALVFFYKDPRSKKVRIHAIDDWSVVKHDE